MKTQISEIDDVQTLIDLAAFWEEHMSFAKYDAQVAEDTINEVYDRLDTLLGLDND